MGTSVVDESDSAGMVNEGEGVCVAEEMLTEVRRSDCGESKKIKANVKLAC